MIHHMKLLALFESEEKVYSENTICEMMIANKVMENRRTPTTQQNNTVNNDSNPHPQNVPYAELADKFTYDEVLLTRSNLSRGNIESFVRARSSRKIRSNKISYDQVPKTKALLFDRLWAMHNAPIHPRMYPNRPNEPSRP